MGDVTEEAQKIESRNMGYWLKMSTTYRYSQMKMSLFEQVDFLARVD
jgi:hypothetical protein